MIDGALETLIIDDSPTDAQMLSYLVTRRLNCRVEVVHDGVQGLDKLSSRKFDLVFLDLLMPVMNGIEVLKEIRGYSETADLPIVIISGVADPRTVRSLLQLKVLDYIIKPYNAEMIVRRLSEKLSVLRNRLRVPALKLPVEDEDSADGRPVVLVADGDSNFRHFCSETLGDRFRVVLASNGAQAVALAMKLLPSFIFAGSRLGVFDRDRMVAKLRQTPELAGVKIFAVNADGQTNQGSPLYDAAVRRTFVAEAFLASSERWLSDSALPLSEAESIAHLREALVSATEQVFGMMMSAEVCVDEDPPPPDATGGFTHGLIRLASFNEAKRLTVAFCAGGASVKAMSARMLNVDNDRDAEAVQLAHSSLAEVLNIIAGRLNNSLDEEGREFVIGFPTVEERSSPDRLDESHEAIRIDFTAGDSIHFTIAISIGHLPKSRLTVSDLAEGMIVAETLDLPNGSKLGRGCKLTQEQIGSIERGRVEGIEVFEAF